ARTSGFDDGPIRVASRDDTTTTMPLRSRNVANGPASGTSDEPSILSRSPLAAAGASPNPSSQTASDVPRSVVEPDVAPYSPPFDAWTPAAQPRAAGPGSVVRVPSTVRSFGEIRASRPERIRSSWNPAHPAPNSTVAATTDATTATGGPRAGRVGSPATA